MPLADILQWVKTTSRSGSLSVDRDGNEWQLEFENGRVVAYTGPEVREQLGYIVVTSGLINEDALREAYQIQRENGGSLQHVLLSVGLVTQAQLSTCLRELVIESIYDLFIDLPATFIYSETSEGDMELDFDAESARLAIDLEINMLMLEGARRHDEWEEIRARFPQDDVPIRIFEDKMADFHTLGLRERRILTGIRGGHTISDICFEMRTPIPAVLRIVAQLEQDGYLEILNSENARNRDQFNRVQQLCAQSQVLREAGQYDEAIALLEVAVRMRPDVDTTREALKETLEEQIKALYVLLPPVKVPVLVASHERITRLRLRPEERFLLDRLSAQMDIGSLIMVSSLNERETLKTFRKLLHSGIIELR